MVASLSMEAWPGVGTSVWCLLDKQAPGSGGIVDAHGAGDAPVQSLILFFLYTHERTQTPAHTHTHIHAHGHTFPKEAEVCLHRKADFR